MQVQLECYSLRVRAKMRLWALFTINLLLSFEWVFLISTASPPRYRGRCWAAIQLSHRPELSGCVVRGEVDGLTVKDDMVDGLFCATLTGHRGGHTPFLQAGRRL